MIWWVWFRLQRPVWIPRVLAAVTLLLIVGFFVLRPPIAPHIPYPLRVGIGHALDFSGLFLEVLMLLVAVLGIRKQGLEGWIVLPALLLVGIAGFRPSSPCSVSPTAGSPSGCSSAPLSSPIYSW